MRPFAKKLILISGILFLISSLAYAGGLSSTFVEVKLKDFKLGKAYSLKDGSNKPLIIKNTTENNKLDIVVEVEKPVGYNLVPGYEPIPDISWVVIPKYSFKKVPPGKSIKTDIIILIPKKGEYAYKKYQVYLYSHTSGTESFRIGLMGRILIETAGLTD